MNVLSQKTNKFNNNTKSFLKKGRQKPTPQPTNNRDIREYLGGAKNNTFPPDNKNTNPSHPNPEHSKQEKVMKIPYLEAKTNYPDKPHHLIWADLFRY